MTLRLTNTSVNVTFTDMAYGGDAVGRDPDSGVAVFGWPGIKGEEDTVEVTGRRLNLVRGIVTHVSQPSPLRIAPPCPYFGPCGGCQWQHIAYAGQVDFKNDILRSQLTRIAGIEDPPLKPPIASPRDYHYRNTSHFALDPASASLGYFKRDSHSIIPVAECPISNNGVNAAIHVVNSMLAVAPTEEFLRDELRGLMRVWQVAIRSSEITGHTVIVFHTRAGGRAVPASRPHPARRMRTGGRPDEGPTPESGQGSHPSISLVRRELRRAVTALARQAAGQPNGDGLALTVVEVMDDGTVNLLGETRAAATLAADASAEAMSGTSLKNSMAHFSGSAGHPPLGAWLEKLGGRNYWVAPDAFFQVNTAAADLLLREVMQHVPTSTGLLVDAHAGVGTFALALADRADRVIGFESDNSSVASARWTASSENLTNVDFRHGRAETLLPRLTASEQPDLILLDPPRSGCHPALLSEITRRQIPLIIYVSCDPSTLARDIKALAPHYALTSARMVDMFPQTFHLETVAVLTNGR